MTTVKVLTPPGTGAIAVLEVRGPGAWLIATTLFKPAKGVLPPLPAREGLGEGSSQGSDDLATTKNPPPPLPKREGSKTNRQRWFGTFAGDEVILAVTGDNCIELHCHGGRAVVAMVHNQMLIAGCVPESPPNADDPEVLLPQAKTLRTAGILLDQCNGAFDSAVREILSQLDHDHQGAWLGIRNLLKFNQVGQHLVKPWTWAIVGAPNVGKSSLINALAGYERALVSPIPGTTRDAVRVQLAFDGWPVELIDTAGSRETTDELEAEGIRVGTAARAQAELTLRVIDGTDATPPPSLQHTFSVVNKCDLPQRFVNPGYREISATTGAGIPELIEDMIALQLQATEVPEPGDAVPFTRHLVMKLNAAGKILGSVIASESEYCDDAEDLDEAGKVLAAGKVDEARTILTSCLVSPP